MMTCLFIGIVNQKVLHPIWSGIMLCGQHQPTWHTKRIEVKWRLLLNNLEFPSISDIWRNNRLLVVIAKTPIGNSPNLGWHDEGTVQFSPGDKYEESLESPNDLINFDHPEVIRVSNGQWVCCLREVGPQSSWNYLEVTATNGNAIRTASAHLTGKPNHTALFPRVGAGGNRIISRNTHAQWQQGQFSANSAWQHESMLKHPKQRRYESDKTKRQNGKGCF